MNRRPRSPARYVTVNLGATAVLLTAARCSGLTLTDLGFTGHPGGWRHGARTGVAAACLLSAALMAPKGRTTLRDQRMAGMTARALTGDVLLRIPLGTVALEEVAFRGVLPALSSEWISCVTFGLWHIAPTRLGLDLNGITSPRTRAGAVAVACAATAAAGQYLCLLRHRGGLAAPMTAHAAVNGLCAIATVIAHRERAGPSRSPKHPPCARCRYGAA
jgi:uncharacterized protein